MTLLRPLAVLNDFTSTQEGKGDDSHPTEALATIRAAKRGEIRASMVDGGGRVFVLYDNAWHRAVTQEERRELADNSLFCNDRLSNQQWKE